jgi:hypothetical protein
MGNSTSKLNFRKAVIQLTAKNQVNKIILIRFTKKIIFLIILTGY